MIQQLCVMKLRSHNTKTTKTLLQKNVQANFNEKKAICKTQNFYILLAFLLITIALLIDVSIYSYLINIKQNKTKKHLLPFYVTNNKLKEVFD